MRKQQFTAGIDIRLIACPSPSTSAKYIYNHAGQCHIVHFFFLNNKENGAGDDKRRKY